MKTNKETTTLEERLIDAETDKGKFSKASGLIQKAALINICDGCGRKIYPDDKQLFANRENLGKIFCQDCAFL
jgi:hypothetical protein